MNVLLIVGLIVLVGTFSGRLFNRIRLPRVTGYIILGVILSPLFGGAFGADIESFRPIISLALGIIGFMIGSELDLKRFRRYSRSIYTILFFEAFLAFTLVTWAVTLITGELYMGLLLGSLAAATAPASTYSVLGEYKARGPLTMTTFSVIALDDAVALVLYGFVSVFARSVITREQLTLWSSLGSPLLQIGASVLLGGIAGYLLDRITRKITDREMLLPCAFGMIVLVVGLAIFIKADMILASMLLGAVAANIRPLENREIFDVVKKFSSPIFVLFFVLLGARMDTGILFQGSVLVLALVYVLARSSGKMIGAYIGGKLSRAKNTVSKYLGFCLLDQAGVAVGLAIATFHSFTALGPEAHMAGLLVVNIITATTFILELFSPSMIKFAVFRSDEANRNISEKDVIDNYLVSDVMDEDFFVIKENYNLHQIIDIMKESDSYHFCVVGMDGKFVGVISLGEVRDAFYEEQMDDLVLARDLVCKVENTIESNRPLSEAVKIFESNKIDYLPVLLPEDPGRLIGQLNYRYLKDRLTKEVIMRQQELEK